MRFARGDSSVFAKMKKVIKTGPAAVAWENALPRRIIVSDHLSYSVSPAEPFVISLPAGGASVA